MVSSEPNSSRPGLLSRFSIRRRAGSTVLVGALFAGVLTASIGAGYSVTQPDLSNATAVLPRGNTVTQVNGETQRVEAEARALATGGQELEVVTLADGRSAVVNNTTKQVRLLTGELTEQGTAIDRSDSTTHSASSATDQAPADQLIVVPANDATYLVDPVKDVAELIDPQGKAAKPVVVPGGANQSAVPDGADGIWVLTDDNKVAHIVRGDVRGVVSAAAPVEALTFADGRAVAITATGAALDIGAESLQAVTPQAVPHGPAVVAGSPRGAGRYLVVLDRKDGRLVVADPRTSSVREFTDLPHGPQYNLGAPVVLDDRVYVPDYAKHRLYVRDLSSGSRVEDVPVPGNDPRFTVEVRERRVWANDQFDRRAVTVSRDGRPAVVDKGDGPGVKTDTTKDKSGDGPQPTQPSKSNPTPATVPSPPAPPEIGRDKPTQTSPTSAPPRPAVTVPVVPQGTSQAEACNQITAANLRCEVVEIGAGGPTGTVRQTQPAGGARVPEYSVVRVQVYGPIQVPGVVGLRTDAACRDVESGGGTVEAGQGKRLVCDRQPMATPVTDLSKLDVVAEQTPETGRRVDSGSTVTVRFWNFLNIENLVGRNGTDECNHIMTSSNNLVRCQIKEGSEAPPPQQAGTVETQSPAAGAAVKIGDMVTLTIYRQQVPMVDGIPLGTDVNQGCATLQQHGYVCNPVPDGVSSGSGVTSQEPRGGTPQQGGTVTLHYSPHAAETLVRLKSTTQPDVWIVRFAGESVAGYVQDAVLGKAYRPNYADQPNTGVLYGFQCPASKDKCGNRSPNHYVSRDQNTEVANWSLTGPIARLLNPSGGQCGAGQVMISRLRNTAGGNRLYTVLPTGNVPAGWVDVEQLGCVWR